MSPADLISIAGLGGEAIIIALLYGLFLRVGRIESDINEIGRRADVYESKVDVLSGEVQAARRTH